jgi:polysaccharide export outer membrane protein
MLVPKLPKEFVEIMATTSRITLITCFGLFLCGLPAASAQAPEKTTKELIEYIQNAKKLGLKDAQIRQNAITAGWDKARVDEAFVVIKYIGSDSAAPLNGPARQGEPASVKVPEGYRIGAGDVLQVVVWKEPDASAEAQVRADGKITLPLVKDVEVLGMTPIELEKHLTEKLSKFVKGADVTVIPKRITSWKVYMVGGLKKEGPLPIESNMTILQAINQAGGLSDYAKRKKIYVLRNEGGKQMRFPFDYQAVIRGEHMEQNILLRPDDTVVVPH